MVMLIFLHAEYGCQKMILCYKGVRNPSIQTSESVKKFLLRKGVEDYDGSFILKDSISFMKLVKHITSYPSVSYFTPQGELIVIRDSGFCAGVAYNYGISLKPGSPNRIDSSFMLLDLNPLIQPLSAQKKIEPGDADVILVGFWATYLGSVNNNVFGVCDAVRNNSDVKARIYLINIDFLDSWGQVNLD